MTRTMRKAALAAALLGVAWCTGCARRAGPAPRSAQMLRRSVELQGHRGCRGLRPENTLAAFRHAIALGVDVLELDLGMSKDGVLVVAHDPEINAAICGGGDALPSRQLRELTWDEIRTLDCGSRKNPRFPAQQPVVGERMPRLEQVLDLLAAHPRLRANIEIKTFADRREATWPPERFAHALVDLLRQRGIGDRVVVQSFDEAALRAVRALAPELTLAALAEDLPTLEALLARTGARIASPKHTALRAGDTARMQRRGIRVIPWTVNEPEEARRLVDEGVDGLITDRPDLLRALLHTAERS
jgi:glycerophosphoryl diester phosphodiesterase